MAAIWTSLGFPARARFLPLLTGVPIVALLTILLVFLRRSASGEIMAISGLRSLTVTGAGRTAAIIAAFTAALIILSTTIGLQYAVIAFAIAFPLVMSEGRMRWIAGASAGAVVAIVSLVLLDRLMGVLWPDPVLWQWVSASL